MTHLPIVRPADAAALIAVAPADMLTPAQVARLVAVLRPLAQHGEQRYHTREPGSRIVALFSDSAAG